MLGGGIVTVDKDMKLIRTYGMSARFGKPDRQIVEQMLKAHFPDYQVDAQVTDYIRG